MEWSVPGDRSNPGGAAVVVIDVFRAFSTAAYAAAWGAERILLVDTLDAARMLQSQVPGALTVTDGYRRRDIDLVNSPALLAAVPVAGRVLIFKTTNGTVAALAARHARPLLCASFANAGATAQYLRDAGTSQVSFVASGGPKAAEDLACAEYLAALLSDPLADPSPYVARAASADARGLLDSNAARGHTGIHPDDAAYCLRLDAAPVALLGAAVEDYVELTPCVTPPVGDSSHL